MNQKVIVEIRQSTAKSAASLTAADTHTSLPGLAVDTGYTPVPVDVGDTDVTAASTTVGGKRGKAKPATGATTYLIRGEVSAEDRAALAASPDVVAVWTDAEVSPFGCGCGGSTATAAPADMHGDSFDIVASYADSSASAPLDLFGDDHGLQPAFALEAVSPCMPVDCEPTVAKGTIADVARFLGCDRLWSVGVRGQGVVVGVVDTGIDAARVPNVIGGWTPDPAYPPGTDPGGHGSMCATDVLGMAPDAKLLDIGLLKSGGGITGFLSDAITAYHWALTQYRSNGTPQILSNSWGMYQAAWAPDYVSDPNHPFTRKVVEVVDAGMIVTFAAGNCGQVCPSGRCGGDNGPGRSIWGANGHPKVITVGAANIRGEWIGYTSQGPAALDPKKPDFCAPSHFKGYTNSDNGTSAANPVCAGVIALFRGHGRTVTTDRAKQALAATATNLCAAGWDNHSGHGMINAAAAYNKLFLFETPIRQASWIHGHSGEAERLDEIASFRRYGFYGQFEGRRGTSNWFHFALPTPVIMSGQRLRLDSVMTRLITDPDVIITNVHVFDGEARIQAYDGLALSGSRAFDRFDVLNRFVRFGIGVTIGVRFGTAEGPHRISFISVGGDFIA